ncbi:Alcohol dehydrogenase [NADP(+)] [Toxocara canis]|uniref:Alcohol dehydrogenase [NADP(+)] n=2 Tax=Toxocara canis TaxID=6265 RepID=A0A0B2VBZ9_TOXCA|nr:Alcohol dehydrogenase [NADP(+)] [Toxocara canis]VDM50289.1 unnamed protein product [Toxocara canis]
MSPDDRPNGSTEMIAIPTKALSSGYTIPVLGLGTWLSGPGEVGSAVEYAVKHGYRHIDCAYAYLNQKEVGEALSRVFSEKIVERKEMFITSKIWNTFHSYELARKCVDEILADLRLDYLDLCLIHWPHGYEEGGDIFPKTEDGKKMRYSSVDYLETWHALEDCVRAGKIRSVGISNFNHKQIARIIHNCTVKPSVLQVELHPYFQQRKLREFCQSHEITITAYSPLGNPSMPFRKEGDAIALEDSVIKEIAQRHNKTPAQVILRWEILSGIVVIPKSTSEKRIIENSEIFDFELGPEEMAQINGLDRNWRILDLTFRDGDHPLFPFNEEY